MATAIWEYDPSLSDNRVLNGSLDVITANTGNQGLYYFHSVSWSTHF